MPAWSRRGSLFVGAGVVGAVAVVAIVVWGGVLPHPGSGTAPGPRVPSNPPPALINPLVKVTSESWVATNATVPSTLCPNCSSGVPTNGTLNVTVRIQSDCDPLGCSARLLTLSVAAPFALLRSSVAFPDAFVDNNTTLTVAVRAPADPGNYTLHGVLTAAAPPPVFVTTGADWAASYSDATGSYLNTTRLNAEFGQLPPLPPGSQFTSNLSIANPSALPVNLTGVSLGNGFVLLHTSTTFPATLSPGANVTVEMETRAPSTNGSGTLQGTVLATVYGTVRIGGSLSIEVDPFVEPGWGFPSSVTMLSPNQTFHFAVTFDNATPPTWYHIAFSGMTGSSLVVLVSYSPHGDVNITDAPGTVDITLQFPSVIGVYSVSVNFVEDAIG